MSLTVKPVDEDKNKRHKKYKGEEQRRRTKAEEESLSKGGYGLERARKERKQLEAKADSL